MYKIRPHHGICAAFFRGYGYNGAFAANMAKTLTLLRRENPMICLCIGEDVFCAACPNEAAQCVKAARYDRAVLQLCNLREGDVLRRDAFCELVRERILANEKWKTICGDCEWFPLCNSLRYEETAVS